MQTKQSQRAEFIKRYPSDEDEHIADFWLQKQDQLLTELGKSLEKEKHEWDSDNDDDFYFDAGIEKALSLINKFK